MTGFMDEKIDLTEMKKLEAGLKEKGIEFHSVPLFNGMQIIVGGPDPMNCDWDAVCHFGSYGHDEGLIEIMGSIVNSDTDDVEGWLTADDILKRL